MPLLLILFGAAFTLVVCTALGRLLLRSLSLRFAREEEALFAFVIGGAGLSLLIFLLCAAQLAHPAAFLALGVVIVAVSRRSPPGLPLPPLTPFTRRFYAALLAVFFAFYLVHALAPETSPDGVTYHLGLVSRYLREGGFHRITTDIYASFPQATEMLFLAAFAFGKHSAAKLVHFAFFAALPALMICYARRFGFPSAGACAAVLVFAAPVAGMDGASAYNDLAAASAVFALFYLLELWDFESARLLVPAGLLAGFAFAIKYTAFTALLYALAFVAWKSRHRLRDTAIVAAAALPMALPWLVKNWLWVANPLSPFFNHWFPNPYVHLSFERDYSTFLRLPLYYGLQSHWELPLALTLRGNLTGVLGPLFLLAPLALLALRWPHGRRLLLAAAVFASTYPANLGCRFLLPALPFLSLALALVFSRVKALAPALALAHAVTCFPPIQQLCCPPLNFRLMGFPLRAALRLTSEEDYLQSALPTYAQARLIERHVPPNARVLAFDDVATAYTSREVLGPYHSALSWLARDLLDVASKPAAAPTRHLRFRFPGRSTRRLRLLQTGTGPESWSIHEIHILRRGVDLPRTSAWRLTAHPNPWDVEFAFDHQPVTRWRTWQPISTGMFLEIDFGEALTLDEVLLETSPDQPNLRLTLDGQSPETTDVPPPPGLRRAATTQLKNLGISYLFVPDTASAAPPDLRSHTAEWNLTPLAFTAGARLLSVN